MHLLTFGIVFLTFCKSAVSSKIETIIKDCYSYDKTKICGVCGHSNINTPEKCTYPFNYLFQVNDGADANCKPNPSSGSCTPISKHCTSEICQNGGTCKEGYGTYRCKCPDTHYGMDCELKREANKKYAEGIQVFINHQVKFLFNTSIVITTDVGGSDLVFKMESEKFQLDYVDTPILIQQPHSRQNYCKKHTGLQESDCAFIRDTSADVYHMIFRYPYINNTISPCIFKGNLYPPLNEDNVGYFDNIRVTAFQSKRPTYEKLTYLEQEFKTVFDRVYPIFTYYNNQTLCRPVIALDIDWRTSCSIDPRNMPLLRPRDEVPVGISYDWHTLMAQRTCNRMLGQNNRWRDRVKISRVLPHYHEEEWKSGAELKGYDPNQAHTGFDARPHNFEGGIYQVKYVGYFSEEEGTFTEVHGYVPPNFMVCYFEIKRELLIAEINDGINQTVVVNSAAGFTIDATRSKNLNRADGLRLMKWTCKIGTSGEPCFTGNMFNDTSDLLHFSGNILQPDKVYTFTLKLYEPEYELTTTYAFIALDVKGGVVLIQLTCPSCWSGIIANPIDYNVLVIKHLGKKGNYSDFFDYIWNYKEVDDTDYKSADELREGESETIKTVFKIGKNKLDYGKSYEFYVSVKSLPKEYKHLKENPYSELVIKTPDKHIKSCEVTPSEGVKGVTLFNLKCKVEPVYGISYAYEFFDKNPEDEELFDGRMFGSGAYAQFANFRLTRGEVSVVSFDSFRVNEEIKVTVKLSDFNEPVTYVDQLIDGVKTDTENWILEFFHIKTPSRDMALATVVAEILSTNMKRSNIIEYLIRPLLISKIHYMADIKMCISSIRNILLALFKLTDFTLSAGSAKTCADIILSSTMQLYNRTQHRDFETTLTHTIAHQMGRFILDSVSFLVTYKNPEVLEKIEEFVNPVILDLVHDASKALVQALDYISEMSLLLQIPGDAPLELSSVNKSISSWVKVTFPTSMHTLTTTAPNIPLDISEELAKSMKDDLFLGVQLMFMTVNPFWWAGGDIVTRVLLITFCNKNHWNDFKRIHRLRYPTKIYYDISTPVREIKPIQGVAIDYSETSSPVEKDLELVVHRVDPPHRGKLFIKFLFEGNQGEYQYRVYFMKNQRPDSDDMQNAVLVNKANPVYNLTYQKTTEDLIYYMGILPVGPPGSNQGPNRLPFTLHLYYTKCKTWLKWQWTGRGCWVGDGTDEKTLECDCSHLSLFASTVITPPNDKFDIRDIGLWLTRQVNFLPFIILMLILIAYVIFFAWCVLRDKKDKKKTQVIVLEDNYPRDKHMYLIAVYTGGRIKSGSEANVGIKLLGSKADSRPHILKSSYRKTMRSNSDDWFLIFSPYSLGKLTCVHVWHDNSSGGPDWFLNKVKAFDLKRNLEYIFYVNEWLDLNLDSYPEVLVAPATLTDLSQEKNTIVENLVVGLQDSHYWTSVLYRHARDPVTRVHRIQVIFCFTLSAMAVSLLLYLAGYTFTSDEDEPSYRLTSFDVWVFLVSIILATTVACLIMWLFRNSFSFVYNRRPSSIFVRKGSEEDSNDKGLLQNLPNFRKQSNASEETTSIKKTYFTITTDRLNDNFIEYNNETKSEKKAPKLRVKIYRILQRTPLFPIQLIDSKSGIKVNKIFLASAWFLCCAVTLICCAIVLTFGWWIEPVHGYQWATVFFLVLLIDILIFSMLKIVVRSAILTIIFKRMIPIDRFILDMSPKTQKKIRDSLDVDNVLEMRSQDMYQPLSHKAKDAFLVTVKRRARWDIVFQVLTVLVFLIILTITMTSQNYKLYQSNHHAKTMISHGHRTAYPNFQEVFNRTNTEDFLQHNFISQLYKYLWYNLKPLADVEGGDMNKLDFTDDSVSRLVGNAYLRQLRVKKDLCSVVAEMRNISGPCSPTWSMGWQDRGNYYVGWTNDPNIDPHLKTTAWDFTPPDDFSSSICYGSTANLYPAGGYFSHLGYKRRETLVELIDLIEDQWMDRSTRVLFAQLTLYNTNTDLFSHVILVTEQLATGQHLPLAKVESMEVYFASDIWKISYIVFLIVFTVRALLLMNYWGVPTVLSSSLYRLEVAILAIGYGTVIVYFIRTYNSSYYVDQYQRKGLNEFFSFSIISQYSFTATALSGALLFLVVSRFLCSFVKFGRIFLRFFFSVYLARLDVFWMISYLIVLLAVSWRFIGYLLSAFIFRYFSNVILHPRDFQEYVKNSHVPFRTQIVFATMCFISSIFMMLFTTLFCHFYKIAQSWKVVDVSVFHFLHFLKEEFKRLIKWVRKKF